MENCITCGRLLESSPSGGRNEVCPTCRASAIDARAAYAPDPGLPPRAAARKLPPVTTILVGINVAVYVVMVLSGVSAIQPSVPDLLKWGADAGPLSLRGEPWRILASNYVHAGILHIGLNMWCLWNLGALAERVFDRWTYLLTYTACGIAGSLASLWIHPMEVSVGASGAIFGIAGALIAALYLGRLPVPPAAVRSTLKSLLTFAAYNLFFGAVVGVVDNSAHIGGLLAGLAIGAALAKHVTAPPEIRNGWRNGVVLVSAILLAAAFFYLRRG